MPKYVVMCERSVRQTAEFELEAQDEAEAIVQGQSILAEKRQSECGLNWISESVGYEEVEGVDLVED